MTGRIEISDELREWAYRAGYETTPASETGDQRAILWNRGGEVRYFVGVDYGDWVVVTESDQMSEERFYLASRSLQVIERHFFGRFGELIRRRLDLAELDLPDSEQEVRGDLSITTVDFAGRERRALVDSAGQVIATSSGDSLTAVWRLAELSAYLTATVPEIKQSFEDPGGRPLFTVVQDSDSDEPFEVPADAGQDFMSQFEHEFAAAGGSTVAQGFSVVDDAARDPEAARRDEQIRAQASTMLDRPAQELAYLGPSGWREYRAVFALTVRGGAAQLEFGTQDGGWQPARVPGPIVEMVRRQREFTAQMSAGPWWRLIMTVTNQGLLSVSYDYGDEPFPDDQLQPPQNYRDDIEPLPDTWTRWAVLAAAYAGARSPWGPRITPGLAWYESDARSGSTLFVLPGNRAVLSGGLWNSGLLVAAYQQRQPLPDLYAGAPAWVNDSTLNTRNQNGLLTFCYWWSDNTWWRGATNTFDELDDPIPEIWTPQETVAAMTAVVGSSAEKACHELVVAGAAHQVTREHLAAALAEVPDPDVEAAYNQLVIAGLTQ